MAMQIPNPHAEKLRLIKEFQSLTIKVKLIIKKKKKVLRKLKIKNSKLSPLN